jgi:hypothetical protein
MAKALWVSMTPTVFSLISVVFYRPGHRLGYQDNLTDVGAECFHESNFKQLQQKSIDWTDLAATLGWLS